MSRTYAQIVSGVTLKMDYDSTTKIFLLEYYNSQYCTTNTTQVSEIFFTIYIFLNDFS